MKSNYWSCSKFADWLRGTPKLIAGTAEEWKAWRKTAKIKKFRYWLAEEALDYLQDFICWPANRIRDMRNYINNRWITKSHALNSNLKPGNWYDYDMRLLHAVFDELVNFVEIELAWMHVVFSDEERKKYKTPWYRTFLSIRSWRSADAGMAYLDWAMQLKHDEIWIDKSDPNFGQPTAQALAAQEILLLYQWWKNERPLRVDASEASGWSAYCDETRKNRADQEGDSLLDVFITPPDEEERKRQILDIYSKIEDEQEEEDTAMLIRLVKLRKHLWT